MIWFTSDNAGPAAPEIMASVMAANDGYTPGYGAEDAMARVTDQVRATFKAPDAAVYLVGVGTAGNALALATMVEPWSTIYCHEVSHIEQDECGAPEFYAGGAKLTLVGGPDAKISVDALQTALANGTNNNVHNAQRGALSVTNVTELGGVYTVAEVTALAAKAKEHGVPVHMDGARFANALAATNASPAEMTWKAGVDVLTFGGTKNGCMGVEAVVFFDPAKAWEFELRRKRGGHLYSKHRYLSAQMEAYLKDDLWLRLAKASNTACAKLVAGLKTAGVEIRHGGVANMIFPAMTRATHQRLQEAGMRYYVSIGAGPADEMIQCRLVTNWSTTDAEIDTFLSHLGG